MALAVSVVFRAWTSFTLRLDGGRPLPFCEPSLGHGRGQPLVFFAYRARALCDLVLHGMGMVECRPRIFHAVVLFDIFRRARKVSAAGERLRPWMSAVWIGAMGGGALAQGINIIGATESRGALYVAGILVLLIVSGIQFVLLALSSVAGEPQ